MPTISPLSVIDPGAVIADDVHIGPFCRVGPLVNLGPGNRLLSHVVIDGQTIVGRNNVFHPHCVVGGEPQDKKYRGGSTLLEIGNNNIIREAVTIHTGTEVGGNLSRIGSGNLLMINVHVAHDVKIGDNCILANNVTLAGHIVCGDCVNIMGLVGIHHFVTIGDYAYIGGAARIHHDVPPFVKIDGADHVRGLNAEGLRRACFAPEDIEALHQACRRLFSRRQPLAVAMQIMAADETINPHVARMLEFLRQRDQGKNGRYLEGLRTEESRRPGSVR